MIIQTDAGDCAKLTASPFSGKIKLIDLDHFTICDQHVIHQQCVS